MMENNDSSEWIYNEWQEIDAKVNKAASDLEEIGRKLENLMSDIEFWSIVFDLEDETAE
jgi:hypothetical protein